mmetsp:Transcript_12303/g.50670  ORF Transcript_12303/g.50670 Transcript_12303/m.50670 type:complete len:149 (+) Transcript_12303:103-549(+)
MGKAMSIHHRLNLFFGMRSRSVRRGMDSTAFVSSCGNGGTGRQRAAVQRRRPRATRMDMDIAVLLSGGGRSLENILRKIESGDLADVNVKCVLVGVDIESIRACNSIDTSKYSWPERLISTTPSTTRRARKLPEDSAKQRAVAFRLVY